MRITASSVIAPPVVENLLSDLDYIDLKFSDRKEDARLSQIDW